jgi:hypothetical protein
LYSGLSETIKIVEKQMQGMNQMRKLKQMMKRSLMTQIKKPGFFYDEFVKVAIIFVLDSGYTGAPVVVYQLVV